MLSVTSQPIPSVGGSFSHRDKNEFAPSLPDSPADRSFGSMLMDLLPDAPAESEVDNGSEGEKQNKNGAQVHMDLHSEELGRIRLRVSMKESRVKVHMLVRDDETRRRVEEQLGPLRSRFADLGLELTRFDVAGGTSGDAEHSEPELSADLSQTDADGLPKLRNALAQLANSQTLVDIIA
jgi:hypothetical protein